MGQGMESDQSGVSTCVCLFASPVGYLDLTMASMAIRQRRFCGKDEGAAATPAQETQLESGILQKGVPACL